MDVEPAAPDTKDWTWVLQRRCPECGLAVGEVAPPAVAGRLRAAAAAWAAVLGGADVRRRPQPRTWSPLEYGAHVRDLLEVARGRVVAMTTEDDPLFADWDQDAAAAAGDYPGQDPAAVAVALTSATDAVAALLDGVSGDAWQRPGRRSNGSAFTVASFARYLLHDVEHHLHDVGAERNEHAPAVRRLMTSVDVRGDADDPRRMSLSARHEAVLADGRRVLLLDDRGWTGSGPPDIWAGTSAEDVVDTARVVVGPDEPFGDRSHEDVEAEHWAHLARLLGQQGIPVEASELEHLPHDVALSERLLARIGHGAAETVRRDEGPR